MTGRSLVKKLVLLAALTSVVVACGRKGDLEPPPVTTPTIGTQAQQPEQPKQDKPFILDRLIQ
ncbi:MAG: LPS translocon maturation chaperone LptM [Phyllobacterium sp.]